MKGLAGGYSYLLGYVLDYPSKAVLAAQFMRFWPAADSVPAAGWVTIFLTISLSFNLFNVRRYGEIEFWLTTIKITLIVGLISLGILLPMGASSRGTLTGTDSQMQPINCTQNDYAIASSCVSQPGFNCALRMRVAILL